MTPKFICSCNPLRSFYFILIHLLLDAQARRRDSFTWMMTDPWHVFYGKLIDMNLEMPGIVCNHKAIHCLVPTFRIHYQWPKTIPSFIRSKTLNRFQMARMGAFSKYNPLHQQQEYHQSYQSYSKSSSSVIRTTVLYYCPIIRCTIEIDTKMINNTEIFALKMCIY